MKVDIQQNGTNLVASYSDFRFIFTGVRVNADKIEASLKIMYKDSLLFYSRTELMDIQRRWQLARHLSYLMKNIAWDEILTVVFTKAIAKLYKYEPPEKLEPTDVRQHYWVPPVFADPYTLIFSSGGSGKSYLALYLSLLIQNGQDDLFLELDRPYNVLYLDWETSKEDISRRYTLLTNTYDDVKWESPYYRNVSFPIKMIYDELLTDIVNYDIKLIVIDSVVPAIGGSIINADAVGEFFSILKQFYRVNGTRTLLLTHVSKKSKETEQEKSPIGSVYFENYPRLVWELRSISLRNKLTIDLIPYKANIPMPNPLSFVFEFNQHNVFVHAAETEASDELESYIKQLLDKNGPMKVKEITQELKREFGTTVQEVRKAITKLVKAGAVYSPSYGVYALSSYKPETAPTGKNNDDEPPF
jgi:hypothetical protein